MICLFNIKQIRRSWQKKKHFWKSHLRFERNVRASWTQTEILVPPLSSNGMKERIKLNRTLQTSPPSQKLNKYLLYQGRRAYKTKIDVSAGVNRARLYYRVFTMAPRTDAVLRWLMAFWGDLCCHSKVVRVIETRFVPFKSIHTSTIQKWCMPFNMIDICQRWVILLKKGLCYSQKTNAVQRWFVLFKGAFVIQKGFIPFKYSPWYSKTLNAIRIKSVLFKG